MTAKNINKISKKVYPIKELTNGDQLNIVVYEVTGKNPGPHIHLQSSVHGAEVAGNRLIEKIYDYCTKNPINGSLTLIPAANPMAINYKNGTHSQGRFDPVTGENWNRLYIDTFEILKVSGRLKKYLKNAQEYALYDKNIFKADIAWAVRSHRESLIKYGLSERKKVFLLLQELAAKADIVLDLHADRHSERYLFVPEFCKDKAKDLHFPLHFLVPTGFATSFDEAVFTPWVELQKFFYTNRLETALDFESYTVELGSEEKISEKEAGDDFKKMIWFFHRRGLISKKPTKPKLVKQIVGPVEQFKTYFSPCGGLVEFSLAPQKKFKKGDTLATIYPARIGPKTEIKAITDGILVNVLPSALVSEGMELLQVLEAPFIL
jgi:predicted deacylase